MTIIDSDTTYMIKHKKFAFREPILFESGNDIFTPIIMIKN
jgi:hypothetical protein